MGRLCRRLLLFVTAANCVAVSYAETPAGERINNSATLSYSSSGGTYSLPSNTDTILIAERIDVALARTTSGPIVSTDRAIPVLLTNPGNGSEAFRLSADDASATPPTRFAIDADGNGRYDAVADPLLSEATTPLLAPGATLALLLLANDDGFRVAPITIVAQAVTGVGTPGTTFAGRGDGGGDAVIGPTGARAQIDVPIVGASQPTLSKSQAVLAPDGSARPVRGAVVSYTLTATFVEAASGARIDDPVPAGTAYVAGSLALDGQPLSDIADGDAGQADSAAIAVTLGDIAAPGARTVQFQVRIQ